MKLLVEECERRSCAKIFSMNGDHAWNQNRLHRNRGILEIGSLVSIEADLQSYFVRSTCLNISQLSRETGIEPESRNVESNYLHPCPCILAIRWTAKLSLPEETTTSNEIILNYSHFRYWAHPCTSPCFSLWRNSLQQDSRRPRGKSNRLSYLLASRLHRQYSRLRRLFCFHRCQRSFPHCVGRQQSQYKYITCHRSHRSSRSFRRPQPIPRNEQPSSTTPLITESSISALTSVATLFNFLLAILYETYKTDDEDVPGVSGLNVAVGTNLF